MNNEEKERYINLLIYAAEQEFQKNMWESKMKISLVQYTTCPEELCEYGARTCYNSHNKKKDNSQLLKGLLVSGHHSVFEHASASFEFKGISLNCLGQLTRHRIGMSYSVESKRYVEQKELEVVTPHSIMNNEEALFHFNDIIARCELAYKELIRLGIRKEDARFVLPTSTTTTVFVTGNLRAWLHFIELRNNNKAQWEIREVARQVEYLLQGIAPKIFGEQKVTGRSQ